MFKTTFGEFFRCMAYLGFNCSIEPALTRTALPKWLERDLLIIQLQIGVYCIVLSNQSIDLYKLGSLYMLCTLLSAQKLSTVGPVVPGREQGWNLVLVIMAKQLFSFFKPIVHFYINVAALSTFKGHVPACQAPVRVSMVTCSVGTGSTGYCNRTRE